MAPAGWLSCHIARSLSPERGRDAVASECAGQRWRRGDGIYQSRRPKEPDGIFREQLVLQERRMASLEQTNMDLQQKLKEMMNWAAQLQGRIRELVADSPNCKMAAMEAMREQVEADKAQHEDLNKKYIALEQKLKEAEKREEELRADLRDLVEIQGNQAELLTEATRQLDEAYHEIEQQRQDITEKDEEVEKLKTKMWVAREYFEKGDKLKKEQQGLEDKVSELQAQLEQAKSRSVFVDDKEEVCKLQKIIQGKNAQLQSMADELESVKHWDSSNCVTCSQLETEVDRLQQQNRDLNQHKSELDAELQDLRLQIRKMSPYGGSPLGRIRELELQFTQKKQEICELQHKLRAVEAERDSVLEDLVVKEDQLLQQDGKLTMLSQALKQSEAQIATNKMCPATE